jgi:alanyl-tRNA synthetase
MSVYENFDEQKQFACRVIADHARTTAFSIADGILPGNEGRNYVLRKIMRRAIYHGREHLDFKDAFFYKVCDFVVDQMKDAYPELDVQRDFIGKMVRLEEERFGNTLTVGLEKLKKWLEENLSVSNYISFQGFEHKSLAQFYDTYGLPLDLIYVIINQRLDEITKSLPGDSYVGPLDIETFNAMMNVSIKQLQENSQIGKTKQKETIKPIYTAMERTSVRSNFHGYEKTQVEDAKVVALVKDDQQTNELKEGEEGLIVLNETPFYAEAGGQVGDTGFFVGSPSVSAGFGGEDSSLSADEALPHGRATDKAASSRVKVLDTFAPVAGIVLHKSKIEKGSIKVGDTVTATVDAEKRDATRRNHTATHLLHAALREVLGTHVKQAGSVVAPNYLRFDFSHYQPISDEEIKEVEDLVNREILKNDAVNTNLMPVEEAMRSGAMALFGEKYGSDVRVLSIGEGTFSKELCGGTHVRATGDIGSFKILSDEAIASGTRRIRAITGLDAFARFREDEQLIEKSLGALRTQRDNLPSAIERLQEELKRARRENDELKMKIATGAVGAASSNGDEARDVNGVKVVAKIVEGLDKGGMRHLSDTLLAKLKSGVVVLGRTEEDKVSFIVRVSDDLTDRVKAGKIVQEIAPIVGGRGGGKADMAEGGGTDADKLSDALEESYKVVEQMLGN